MKNTEGKSLYKRIYERVRNETDLSKLRKDVSALITTDEASDSYINSLNQALLKDLEERDVEMKKSLNKYRKGVGGREIEKFYKDKKEENTDVSILKAKKYLALHHTLPIKKRIRDFLIEVITIISAKLLQSTDEYIKDNASLAQIAVNISQGNMLSSEKKYDEAEEYFNKAVSLSKNDKICIYDKALKAFKEAPLDKIITFSEKRLTRVGETYGKGSFTYKKLTKEYDALKQRETDAKSKTLKRKAEPQRDRVITRSKSREEEKPSSSPTKTKRPRPLKRSEGRVGSC